MNATPQQLEAILTHDRSLVVEAGAGTGKTWTLVQRFVGLLDAHPDWPLESIVAITFTEKAAREMRNRIRVEIEARAQDAPPDSHWHERRRGLERLMVSTIHGLCSRILRENAVAAGIDPHFRVLDEQESDLLQQDALATTLDELAAEEHPSLRLLDDLRVVDVREELELLLKRRGTVHRFLKDLPSPADLLARWHAGVQTMRATVWQEQRRANPLLDAAMAQLPTVFIRDPGDKLAPSVAAAQEGIAAFGAGNLAAAVAAWSSIKLLGGRAGAWGSKEFVQEIKDLLKALRSAGDAFVKEGCDKDVGAADKSAAEALHLWRDLWLRLDATYTRLKDERQAVDFDDLEILTERLLAHTPSDERLAAFLASVNHLMVDEFQDTNEAQRNIVYAIADPHLPGRLFVVGDAKQSIYRFRQAQVSVFNRTVREIQAISGRPSVPLNESFRAHTSLVAAQNHAFAKLMQPLGDGYADYEARPGPLSAKRPPSADGPCVELLLLPSEDDESNHIKADEARQFEAQLLADRILALRASQHPVWDKESRRERPFRFGDAAVLFRATTVVPLYEEQFEASGVPYLTVSGRGYYDRPEVTDLVALLACLHNPADDLSLAIVLRSPLFSLSDETLMWLRGTVPPPVPLRQALANPPVTGQPERVAFAARTLAELWQMAGRASVAELLHVALHRTGYEATLALADAAQRGRGRQRGNLRKFIALAHDHGHLGLSGFLRLVQNLSRREAREGEAMAGPPDEGAVQLMSVHAAKGLEFPVVAVADLGRSGRSPALEPRLLHDAEFGVVCKQRDERGDWRKPAGYAWGSWLERRVERAECKRLLYVACTRAADLLLLSGRPGASDSWLSDLMGAWSILPDGPEEEVAMREGFAIRVRRPPYAPADRRPRPPTAPASEGMLVVPPLASTAPVTPEPPILAVTRLQRLLESDEDVLPALRPPVRTGSQPADRAPGHVVGEMVHWLLADWESLSLPERAFAARVRRAGQRLGLDGDALADAEHLSRALLANLRRSRLFREIEEAAERQTEVPFSLRLGEFVLHGKIDMLYRDGDGTWHVLDWKTEWRTPGSGDGVSQHLTQLSVYARAIEQATGKAAETAVCYLRPDYLLLPCRREDLEAEWQRLLTLAQQRDPRHPTGP